MLLLNKKRNIARLPNKEFFVSYAKKWNELTISSYITACDPFRTFKLYTCSNTLRLYFETKYLILLAINPCGVQSSFFQNASMKLCMSCKFYNWLRVGRYNVSSSPYIHYDKIYEQQLGQEKYIFKTWLRPFFHNLTAICTSILTRSNNISRCKISV